MKFLHLSDLHLGIRVCEFSMLDDQRYILRQILDIVDRSAPDGVIIAGDVYDRTVPPAEAVELFDDFLVALAGKGVKVFVISGNHDSAERIAFGGRIMDLGGIHVSPVYHGEIRPTVMQDAWGDVNVYMLPFLKPAHIRRFFPDREINSYTDAMAAVVESLQPDPGQRNILITHQFITGALRSESEEVSVGGTDNVDASVFRVFDYVALGHIHNPQFVGSERIRYCGTPLKYSFSEIRHEKSVTVVELGEKGQVKVDTIPLKPLRDMAELRGTYLELTAKSFYGGTSYPNDYVHIILTDEEDIPDAVGKLRTVYPNLMKLTYDNTRTRKNTEINGGADVEKKTPLELFSEFFVLQNNKPMTLEQEKYMKELMENVWEEGQ